MFDEKDQVIGKLGHFDILTALESKYSEIGDLDAFSGIGLTPSFIRSLLKKYSIWSKPLDLLCSDAAEVEVRSIMHILTESEYIDEEASLDEAIHQLIMGHFQSLIVTKEHEIIGIIKLSDIFREICLMIRSHDPTDL